MLPKRDGLKLSVRGGKGRPTMSATEWIGRVPGDPVAVRLEDGIRLLVQRGILEPRVRKRERDARVEGRVRRLVDRRALVGALEVDRVDRACLDELVDQSVVPRPCRVELEAQVGIEIEQARSGAIVAGSPNRIDATKRRPAAPRARRASAERLARLAKGEVERRALESPAAIGAELVEQPGPAGQSDRRSTSSEKESIVWCEPARGSVGPSAWKRLLVLARCR